MTNNSTAIQPQSMSLLVMFLVALKIY